MSTLFEEELASEIEVFEAQLKSLLEDSIPQISDIMPSEWTEQNMVMQKPFPGPFRYSLTPYTREIIDCLSASVAVDTIVVMKGAQIGFSNGVIYPGIGWIIANSPGNTFLSVGAPELITPAMDKVETMINATGLTDYIKPQNQRKKNNKTGDTNKKKDFAQGFLIVGSANNHKNIRQLDLQYKFLDDLAAIKAASKESGNTLKKLDGRSAAYADSKKTFLISTPELKLNSNIEEAYEKGDKRKFFIPCPCEGCNEYITLEWSVESEKTPGKMCGITWALKQDGSGQLDKSTVGYTCPKCDGFFNDKNKMEWLNRGKWIATAVAKKENYRSYHISALYAPIGMDGWDKYVNDWIEANPDGQPRNEDLWQVFVNECLGLPYEPPGIALKSTILSMNNTRKYEIGKIPEKLSIADGNGKIVLLTATADLGGLVAGINSTFDDVRLDYEFRAWAESGSSYSFMHGSIGSFTPAHMGKKDEARTLWSYDLSKQNNVWRVFEQLISQPFEVDGTGRKMNIGITGIDTGFAEHQAFSFIDRTNHTVIGIKGDKEHKYIAYGDNSATWKESSARSKLYILKVGKLKDQLAQILGLKWDKNSTDPQPPGFVNFPLPQGEMYGLENYFMHFESEERKMDKNKNFIWLKKTPTAQNHFWDAANYQLAVRDILMENVLKDLKVPNGTWTDFCGWILSNREG